MISAALSASLRFRCACLWFVFPGIGLLHADQPLVSPTPGHQLPAPPDSSLPGATSGPASPGTVGEPEIKLVARFDQDGDHRLDAAERQAAREFLAQHPLPDATLAPLRPDQPPPQPLALEPVKPGKRLSPAGAQDFSGRPLYDPGVLRTFFLEFKETDWERELSDFSRTDVYVPARLTVDGKVYPGVGVHFRARTAEMSLPAGYKRSLELTLDHADPGQQLGGQRQLNLLAATTDPTFLRTALYDRVAGEYLPAPKANFVRVVINGENWGVYTSSQPLDENFTQENFHARGGARWTATASGNLAYLGDKPDAYRRSYRLLSPEDPAAWATLIRLCRVINQARPGELEAELAPLLDIDAALRFFALENALINQDGYGSQAGSYGLYLDADGRFHLIPQDAENCLRLVQVTEYDKRPREDTPERARRGGQEKGPENNQPPADGAAKGYNRTNFPRQSETNLAMLLSNSFTNKADTDFDGKITREEWHEFARVWFFAMDEDMAGQLTREEFIAKVRLLITPPSIADGRTRQTFGKEDAAALIGQDLFTALDGNHDGRLTREEMIDTFDRWFASWSDPKTARLTQELLQRAFTTLFTKSVFKADESYIATRGQPRLDDGERENRGGGGRGRRGGGYGGSGLSLGPLHLGGLGGGRGDSRTPVTFGEELDPLAGLDEANKPLLSRLLAAPALRERYLADMREIAENWLTWAKLGPIAQQYHELIATEVGNDTHRVSSYEHFVQDFDQNTKAGSREGDAESSLKSFVEERGAYLQKNDILNSNP